MWKWWSIREEGERECAVVHQTVQIPFHFFLHLPVLIVQSLTSQNTQRSAENGPVRIRMKSFTTSISIAVEEEEQEEEDDKAPVTHIELQVEVCGCD